MQKIFSLAGFFNWFGQALIRGHGVVDRKKYPNYNPRAFWTREFANRVDRRRTHNRMARRSRRINRLKMA